MQYLVLALCLLALTCTNADSIHRRSNGLISKRQFSVEGHANHDANGNDNIGGSISHKSGSTNVGASIDHNSHSGTSYGVNAGHTWSHSDGSKTTLSGNVNHSPYGGTSGGISISHSFGRRLAEMERAVQEMQKRQTSVSGHADKDNQGNTHVGGKVEHTSSDGKTHSEAHVEHSSNGGTSYGGSVSHTFGKRGEDQSKNGVAAKRQTSVEGHASHDANGDTHVGGSVSHKSGSTSVSAGADYSSSGDASVGASASHTWSHSDGSKTTLSGGAGYSSHGGASGSITLSHSFGRRLAQMERAVREMQKRQTSVNGHADKDNQGNTHVGGQVEHTSSDGKTHSEAHVEHSSNGGTSYGGSFSHTFGKRQAA